MTEPTTDPMQRIEELRRPLHDGLPALQRAATAVDDGAQAAAGVQSACSYIEQTLLPIINAEDFTLFIAIDGALKYPGASGVMVAQHRAIRAMCDDLLKVAGRALEADDIASYRPYLLALLHGLYAAIRVHIEAEDDAYLPLLAERLSESQIETVAENLERVTTGIASGEAPVEALLESL